jgi:hypothetical protein
VKRIPRLIWLIPAILSPILLIRGIWALQQPWGVAYQKIIAMGFFLVLWLVSLYFLFQNKFELTPREQEKGNYIFQMIGSGAFVLGGIFMIAIKPEEWIKGALAICFFGSCFFFYMYKNSKT